VSVDSIIYGIVLSHNGRELIDSIIYGIVLSHNGRELVDGGTLKNGFHRTAPAAATAAFCIFIRYLVAALRSASLSSADCRLKNKMADEVVKMNP